MKRSTALPNAANLIAAHVAARFPELARDPIPGVWFTGSNVWAWLYGDEPPLGADWDIFVTGAGAEVVAAAVADRLGLASCPACRTKDKRKAAVRTVDADHVPRLVPNARDDGSYGEGYSYETDSGEVDLWISTPGDVLGELRDYPTASHAHCRVAFSFTDGLVVLGNEHAAIASTESPSAHRRDDHEQYADEWLF